MKETDTNTDTATFENVTAPFGNGKALLLRPSTTTNRNHSQAVEAIQCWLLYGKINCKLSK